MTQFSDRVAGYMAFRYMRIAKEESRSESIAESLHLVKVRQGVAVETPYFWATWYHDGRGPVRARPGHKLVYWKDPNDDPRLAGGYPVRFSGVKRLTKAQFYRYLRNPGSGMIVAESVGPWSGDPFFTRAGAKFKRAEAGQVAGQRASEEMRRVMGDLLNATQRVSIRLPRLR